MSSWRDVTDVLISSPSDFGVNIGTKPVDFGAAYRILVSYIYISSTSTLVHKNQTKDSICHWYIPCFKHIPLNFIHKCIYFKTLVYTGIYFDTIEKYNIAWSAKESNPRAKPYSINTQMDTKWWKSSLYDRIISKFQIIFSSKLPLQSFIIHGKEDL